MVRHLQVWVWEPVEDAEEAAEIQASRTVETHLTTQGKKEKAVVPQPRLQERSAKTALADERPRNC